MVKAKTKLNAARNACFKQRSSKLDSKNLPDDKFGIMLEKKKILKPLMNMIWKQHQ